MKPTADTTIRVSTATLLASPLCGAGAYFWTALTTTLAACHAGVGGGPLRRLGLLVLLVTGPALGAWRASCLGIWVWGIVALTMVAICLSTGCVVLGEAFWSSGHGCS